MTEATPIKGSLSTAKAAVMKEIIRREADARNKIVNRRVRFVIVEHPSQDMDSSAPGYAPGLSAKAVQS